MRDIIIKAYQYDELPTEKAKERARNWYREGNDNTDNWDYITEDAKNIGLKIMNLDPHRSNKGTFLWDALEVAEAIIKEHGKDTETHKTTLRYYEQLKKENDENLLDERIDTEHEFLHDLLEDYRIMLEKEEEYQNSDEQVIEMIKANKYEFTEEGKRI